MDALIQDIRYALRALLRTPGFTLVAVVTLALGIGANTAIFSVVYGALLRSLPYPDPGRLVTLAQTYRQYRGEQYLEYPQFRFLAEHASMLEAAAASASVGFNFFAGGTAFRVDGLRVSRDYFRVLGVAPELGRTFTADEDAASGPAVVILSHALWRRRLASDSGVVGTTVSLDGAPCTVVGVMPESFPAGAEAWSTLAQVGRSIGGGANLSFIARVRSDLSLAAAQAGFEPTVAAYRETFRYPAEQTLAIEPLQDIATGPIRAPLQLLFGAVGLVLLIACANVANLLLGRTAGRGRELALRAAIGASRARIAWQLLTESAVLALAGGALGVVVAGWVLSALLNLAPPAVTSARDIRLDAWALGFAFAAALLTGVLFGLVPALRGSRAELHDSLKEGGRATGTARQGRLRGALVVAEVALSLVLLVGAGLLIGTMRNMLRTDPGFEPRGVLTAEIWLTGTGRDFTAQISGLYRDLVARLEGVPGVRSAAVVEAGLPLTRGGNRGVRLDGEVVQLTVEYRTITPGYFAALDVPLLAGRMFTESDGPTAEPVALVNRAFQRLAMGDSNPIGHTLRYGGAAGEARQIVGVVGDLRSFVTREAQPAVFLPSAQTPAAVTRLFSSWFPTNVVLRAAGDPAWLRDELARAIRETDSRVPVGRVRTMEEVFAGAIAPARFMMTLLSAFAALALVLAAVGLYGVMSHLVTQRTHEIGVRMALGALPRRVLALVVGRGMVLAGLGTAIGMAAAAALTRLLEGQLYGVKAIDPVIFSAVAVFLLLVALLAAWLPARRAARVDPMVALRSE